MESEHNIKYLGITAGFVLIAVGGQPLVNYLSGDTSLRTIWPSAVSCLAGGVLVLVSFIWRPRSDATSKFTQTLAQWASSPIPYAIMLFLVWFYFETLAIQRNNEIVALRNDEQSIAKVVDQLVLPRHLTKGQQSVISRFLSQFEPHEYSFRLTARNEEVGSYRVDIEQALLKGGWNRAAANPYIYADDVPEGLTINFIQTIEHAQRPNDPRNPNATLLLQEAFGLAGVHIYGTGGGSGINVTQDSLTISIGLPRKDSYELSLPDGP